jgi:hypothetical protein
MNDKEKSLMKLTYKTFFFIDTAAFLTNVIFIQYLLEMSYH